MEGRKEGREGGVEGDVPLGRVSAVVGEAVKYLLSDGISAYILSF